MPQSKNANKTIEMDQIEIHRFFNEEGQHMDSYIFVDNTNLLKGFRLLSLSAKWTIHLDFNMKANLAYAGSGNIL